MGELNGVARQRQTALQGLTTNTACNVLVRLVAVARQVVITATFGLSAGLDAYYAAASVVSLVINTFGDLTDSVGVPFLVRARERGGMGASRRLAWHLLRAIGLLAIGLTTLLVLLAPWAHWIFPGMAPGERATVAENIYLFVPYALAVLPTRFLGALFRSQRLYLVASGIDLLVNLLALACLVLLRTELGLMAIPLSFSLSHIVGSVLLLAFAWRHLLSRSGEGKSADTKGIDSAAIRMLPSYAVIQFLAIIDRTFASYLPEGSISALFYGYLLAFALPDLLGVEGIFVTPLAESGNRSAILTRILAAAWLVGLPATAFLFVEAEALVAMLFGRGAFDAAAVAVTGDALRWYALGMPVRFVWGVCIRLLQIRRCFGFVFGLVTGLAVLNAGATYALVFGLSLGVPGVALGTSIAWLAIATPAFLAVRALGVAPAWSQVGGLVPGSIGSMLLAVAATSWLGGGGAGLLARVVVFCSVYLVGIRVLVRTEEMSRLGDLAAASFPRLASVLPTSARRGDG